MPEGCRCAGIAGLGIYVPERVLTNQDLEKMVDTSDAWIRERTGIRERRIAAPEEATSDLAAAAARAALADAGITAGEVDLIIVATATPDTLFPATACLVQEKLGADRAGAFDLLAGCSGFIYALACGAQFIAGGAADTVLVVGAETLSRIVNWEDRNTCVLFGDGAGAVTEENTGIPVLPVNYARERFGPHNQHGVRGTTGNKLGTARQGINKPGAPGKQVKRPGPIGAQLFLHQASRGRKERVGRSGGHDDQIHLASGNAGIGERRAGRRRGQIRRGLFRSGDTPFPNTRSFSYPGIAGIHHLFQVLVRQHPFRNVNSQTRDARTPAPLRH